MSTLNNNILQNRISNRDYQIKQLEINSLLELTQAINNNLPSDQLFKILNFTIRFQLEITKMAFFIKVESAYQCVSDYGCLVSFANKKLPDFFKTIIEDTDLKKIQIFDNEPDYEEFEILIPIIQNDIVLAYIFLSGYNLQNKGSQVLKFIRTFSNILVVAVENKKLAQIKMREELFNKELDIARNVQQMLLPKNLPYSETLKLFVTYKPHHTIGGDYYDYIPFSDQQFLFCIADVAGKGIPAALSMSNFQAALRLMVRLKLPLLDMMTHVNKLMYDNLKGQGYITAFLGIIDLKSRILLYINAGHVPPILAKNGKIKSLEKGSTVIGAFESFPFMDMGMESLPEGSFLMTFTDGVNETKNENQEELLFEKLHELIADVDTNNHSKFHQKVMDAIDNHRNTLPYQDDITILTFSLD